MAFMYPEGCDSPRRKTEFLYKAQENLRLLHNVFSKWLHEGLPIKEYNYLPKKFRDKYIYTERLPQAEWDKFQEEDFTPRSDRICQEICVQRAELKKSSMWSVDIGDI